MSVHVPALRIPASESLRALVWVVMTILALSAGYYSLRASVDTNTATIQRLAKDKADALETRGDLRVIVQKIEDMDRRLSERLDRIEQNQQHSHGAR